MVEVRLENVSKRFGKVVAVDNVSLDILNGEIFTILGPSGCGKTTTLRIIAGFEFPNSGRVFFDERDVTFEKPYRRGTAMVFQNYALWPHMTVYDNIAYGLKLRKLPKEEIRRRVKWVLELVGLVGLEKRFPLQLSGGQQQRVALARAIVVEPSVLLLDEPLSNLDAKLRIRMREEIVSLQRRLGITTIYVTHDQEEAMSISDRIAIMNQGRVYQVGSPIEVYMNPRNLFVATFIGRSNVLKGRIVGATNGLYVASVGTQRVSGILMDESRLSVGDEVFIVIRPESFFLVEDNEVRSVNVFEGKVGLFMFISSFLQVKLELPDGQKVTVYLSPKTKITQGETLKVGVSPEDVKIYKTLEWEDDLE